MATSALKNNKPQTMKAHIGKTKPSSSKHSVRGPISLTPSAKNDDPIHVSFKGRFKITGDIVSPLDIEWGEEWDAKQ